MHVKLSKTTVDLGLLTPIAVAGRNTKVTIAIDLIEVLSDCVAFPIWTDTFESLCATTLKALQQPLSQLGAQKGL